MRFGRLSCVSILVTALYAGCDGTSANNLRSEGGVHDARKDATASGSGDARADGITPQDATGKADATLPRDGGFDLVATADGAGGNPVDGTVAIDATAGIDAPVSAVDTGLVDAPGPQPTTDAPRADAPVVDAPATQPPADAPRTDTNLSLPGVDGPSAEARFDGSADADAAALDASLEAAPDLTPDQVVRLDVALDTAQDTRPDRIPTDAGDGGSTWSLSMLSYRILDAEYSTALDALVFVTDSPDRALHVYNPETGSDVRVALPLGAVAVSVSPSGDKAAVAHDAHVSYVDLVAGTLVKTCDVTSDAIDVVLAGNGWAYVFPATDQWSAIHGIKLDTCTETLSGSSAIYAGTVAKLHPSGTKMYGADRGLSPSDIERYNIGTGAPVYGYDSPYHGDYPMCGDLWISSDGLRIFTGCGRVFRASDTRSEDMTYNGRLEAVDSVEHLSHATPTGKVLVIPAGSSSSYPPTTDADTVLRIHNYQYLTRDRTVQLPSVPGQGSTTFKGHGRFVFAKSDGGAYYVVLKADQSSGLLNDYGVATLNP